MIKSLAIASALLLGAAGGSLAAEVGVRHESGSTWRSVTHGQASERFRGSSRTSTQSLGISYTGGGAGRSNAGGGAGSLDVTTSRTRSEESFRGSSSNNFTGGSNSTFSGSSIFAN